MVKTNDTLINEEIQDGLIELKKVQREETGQKLALIVSGESLLYIMNNPSLKQDFLELGVQVDVVLACRVSPKQKADIVQIVKDRFPDKVTLSIGDGANDVNMITTAHVGVGISGLEGMQAARSADYVIGQFRFLKQLLFKHGREAYRRNAFLVCYNFYKNIVMVLPNFWFGMFSIYSATFIYEKFIYLLYNIVFTSVPIVWYALFDYQFPRELFLIDPKKYKIGLDGECFGSRVFWYWFCYGAVQALLIIIFAFYCVDLENSSIYKSGGIVLGAVVLIVNMQVFY